MMWRKFGEFQTGTDFGADDVQPARRLKAAFALARTTRGGGNRIAARERFAIKKVEPLGGKVNYDAHELASRRAFCCARRSAKKRLSTAAASSASTPATTSV